MTATKQTTDGVTYGNGSTDCAMTYSYNLGGALTDQQYPSCRVVKNELDVSGDLATVTSKENASAIFKTYVNDFTYNAAGAVTSLRLGNGKYESTAFNSRLQPTQIGLGTSESIQNVLKLEYGYGTNANNGNVQSQTITVPGMAHSLIQDYTYDSLNRLESATETSNSTETWKQEFSYDRYGNRNFVTGTGHTTTLGSCTTMCNPTFDTSNNRITSSGFSYDSSGNTTRDAGDRKFTYDAENKQTKAETLSAGTNTVTSTIGEYLYDGDGKRIKKYVPSTGETTIFVYDAAGKLIGEYSTIVENSTNAKVNYLTADHLGSPRVNSDVTGSVIARHDYHPFGEEIATTGSRSTTGYVGDSVRKQFTGYERDDETDLDFAQARMYSISLGRFSATDPVFIENERVVDPQRINLYSYVRNNPLILIDPTGQIIDDSSLKDNKDYQAWKSAYLATEAGAAMWDKYNLDKNFNLTITMGENAGSKYGAETIIKKDNFDSDGKLVSASIVLGSEFAKKEASSDYPIGRKTTATDPSMASGGTYISRTDRAVGFLGHEFGHVEDANKSGAEKWLKESSLLEQNKANFEKSGAKGLDSPELLKQCGGCSSITELKTNREIRAEASSIRAIQQHYGKNMPGRIKNAIKEFNQKYGSP